MDNLDEYFRPVTSKTHYLDPGAGFGVFRKSEVDKQLTDDLAAALRRFYDCGGSPKVAAKILGSTKRSTKEDLQPQQLVP